MDLRLLLLLVGLLLLYVQPTFSASSAGKTMTLWQLPEQTHSQMMSYVIRTGKGKVIVIDGGTKGDAPYLKSFLKDLGNEVEAWFITHQHSDHTDALATILGDLDGLKINRFYSSLLDEEWIRAYERVWIDDVIFLNNAMKNAGRCFNEMVPGQVLEFDNVRVEVLAVKNPELHMNAVNNSSVVLRFQDPEKSVLFLGDLGLEAGEKLMKSPFASRLRSDYVQMAHHGQNGVTRGFYELVRPQYCLWTTPTWLWNNDSGGGKGSGPWKTLEVRSWMEELKPKRSFVTSIDGLVRID